MEQQQVCNGVTLCTHSYIVISVAVHILMFLPPPPTSTHTHMHTSVAPGDYASLTNFRLGPFNNSIRQLSFNVSIWNDNIPEDDEMFNVSLTLDPADQARLGNRVRVSPDVATVMIQDNDGKHLAK